MAHKKGSGSTRNGRDSNAKRLGVNFIHAPLFSKKSITQQCYQPWDVILVDWDGDVYPCTGGEICFYEKVKSGVYYFGNLLKEDISKFWFSGLYVKLRRHLLAYDSEKYIPECDACHNISCFKGPELEAGHIMRRGDSPWLKS